MVEKYVEYCDRFGFDVLHNMSSVFDAYNMNTLRDMTVTRAWDNWDVTVTDERKGDAKRRTITIRTPEGDLGMVENYRRLSTYTVVSAAEEHLIKTQEDFEMFREYAPPADVMDCRMVSRARQATGDKGLVTSGCSGAFNVMNAFRKLDHLMMDPLVDEGFYREMAEYFLGWLFKRVRKMVSAGADVIEIGANIAHGGGGSPVLYQVRAGLREETDRRGP